MLFMVNRKKLESKRNRGHFFLFSRLERLFPTPSKGFSLLELVIGIIVFAIISTVIAIVISNSIRMYGDVRSRKDLNLDGQRGVFLFTREYAHVPQETGLELAEEKKIRFDTNLGYTVEYELQTSELTRKIISDGVKRILAKNVDVNSSEFLYFKDDNTELTNFPLSSADRQQVQKVELLLNMANESDTISYLADVYPENLNLAVGQCSDGGSGSDGDDDDHDDDHGDD